MCNRPMTAVILSTDMLVTTNGCRWIVALAAVYRGCLGERGLGHV